MRVLSTETHTYGPQYLYFPFEDKPHDPTFHDHISCVLFCHMVMQLWQLETLLLQKDTYLNYSQALSYTSQALSQNLHGLRNRSPIRRMSRRLVYFLQENWRRIWVLSVWILIMIGLFLWKFFQYKQKDAYKVMGYCLLTAKGAGETLKFNMALILLPVCRNIITWMRSSKLGCFLPFDDNINFHKVDLNLCPIIETLGNLFVLL